MKILMVLESEFPPDIRVENEMLALTEARHQVHLACLTRKNRLLNEVWRGITIHRKPISTFVYKSSVGSLKFPFYFNFWRKFLKRLLIEDKFDVIHIHDLPLGRVGVEIKYRYNIPLIIDLHENWPALIRTAPHTRTIPGRLLSSNKQWIEYERNVLLEADKVITIIEEAEERIAKLGVDPEKICIVSNTVNFESISITPKSRTDDVFTVFYGGGINRHRGLQIVIQAIKILTDKKINVKFVIVGDGSYRTELEKLAGSLGINSFLRFTGHKPFREMLEILSVSDAAIIPHIRTENNNASSPNKLYQYMYLNKPIISSDCNSLKRIINDTNTGFIYQHDSPRELASLIEDLILNRRLLELTGENGRKAVMEKYNWNTDKRRLINEYKQLENKIK